MIKKKEIGFLKMLYLLYLTAKQEKALQNLEFDKYRKLTIKHFKTYFGLDLREQIITNPGSPEVKAALHRHGCMTICNSKFSDCDNDSKRRHYKVAKLTFINNILLTSYLHRYEA
jgi:hypothetical protein